MKKLSTILIALLLLVSVDGQILRYSNYTAPAPSEILVTSIDVWGTGGATTISTNGGTLQMLKKTLPTNATDTTVTWSRINGTGTADISVGGLLTALTNGTVTARATANDGSAVYGEEVITISNQAEPAVYTDNFNSYTAGNLGGQGNWVASRSDLVVVATGEARTIRSASTDADGGVYYNDDVANDQYAEITISSVFGSYTASFVGVGVRMSSNNQYTLVGSSSGISFGKVVDGVETNFYYGDSVAVNDVLRLEAEGTTIRAYKNGTLIVPAVTDSDLSTGFVGVAGYGSSDNITTADNWEGGDL